MDDYCGAEPGTTVVGRVHYYGFRTDGTDRRTRRETDFTAFDGPAIEREDIFRFLGAFEPRRGTFEMETGSCGLGDRYG